MTLSTQKHNVFFQVFVEVEPLPATVIEPVMSSPVRNFQVHLQTPAQTTHFAFSSEKRNKLAAESNPRRR